MSVQFFPTYEQVLRSKFGGLIFDVREFGADPTGAEDSTGAINACGAAASLTGGARYYPSGTYKVSDSIQMYPNVDEVGELGMTGLTEGDSVLVGTVLSVAPGNYDVFSPPSGTMKGRWIVNLSFDGAPGQFNSCIKLEVAEQCVIANVGMRCGGAALNFILIDGGSGGAYGNLIINCSAACGFGYVGGDAFKIGATSVGNVNTLINCNALSFARGVNFNYGSGNRSYGAWTQSCTTGVRFGEGQGNVARDTYWESNTTDVLFDTNSVDSLVDGGNPAAPLVVTATVPGKITNVATYNPRGPVTVAVPASGTATAALPYDATFYITQATAASSIAVQGQTIAIPVGGPTAIRVPAGQTLTPTYTTAPTWVVMGD